MTRKVLLATATGLVACGSPRAPVVSIPPVSTPPVSTQADFQDGVRLKLPFWRSADGVTRWQGTIYDSARGEPCSFQLAADGRQRCLPDTTIYQEALFGDPACTQPLAEGAGGVPDPYARFLLPTPACEGGTRIELRETGAELGDDPAYALSAAGCAPMQPSLKLVHYHTGRVLPPELFVAAARVVLPASDDVPSRLAEEYLRAEDGARIRRGFYDLQENLPCRALPTSDGELRCVPDGRYLPTSINVSGWPDCSGPPIATEAACTAEKASLIAFNNPTCPPHVQLHAPGDAWIGGQTYQLDHQGRCLAGPRVTAPAVELGPALDPARFARLETQQVGTERLRDSRYVEAGGGASLPSSAAVYDSLLGESCSFGTAPDGELRCVPSTLIPAFRDQACLDPVGVSSESDYCGPAPGSRYIVAAGRLHVRGDRLTAPPDILFMVSPETGACQANYFLVGPTYGVGPEVTTELVAASSVTYP